MPDLDADYFDRWFADIEGSSARQALFTRVLGVPREVGPSNVVPIEGLQPARFGRMSTFSPAQVAKLGSRGQQGGRRSRR